MHFRKKSGTMDTFETKQKVCLRKLKIVDADLMLEWMADHNITKNFRTNFESMTKEKVLEFINNSFSDKTQNFAFVDCDDNYLGTISLKNISLIDNNAEYAIVSRTIAHGTGIASRATVELLEYAFFGLNLHRVYLNVLEDNYRANAFYRKMGFEYEGTSREHLYIDGEYKNLNWYAITKEQFLNKGCDVE